MPDVTESIVQAQVEGERNAPPGVRLFRCVYCNCSFATDHGSDVARESKNCHCEIAVCPNSTCPGHVNDDAPSVGDAVDEGEDE